MDLGQVDVRCAERWDPERIKPSHPALIPGLILCDLIILLWALTFPLCLNFPSYKLGSLPFSKVMKSLFALFVVAVEPSSVLQHCGKAKSKNRIPCLAAPTSGLGQGTAVTCAVCRFASGFLGLNWYFRAWQGWNGFSSAVSREHRASGNPKKKQSAAGVEHVPQAFWFSRTAVGISKHQLCCQSVSFNPLLPGLIFGFAGLVFLNAANKLPKKSGSSPCQKSQNTSVKGHCGFWGFFSPTFALIPSGELAGNGSWGLHAVPAWCSVKIPWKGWRYHFSSVLKD